MTDGTIRAIKSRLRNGLTIVEGVAQTVCLDNPPSTRINQSMKTIIRASQQTLHDILELLDGGDKFIDPRDTEPKADPSAHCGSVGGE